jgi:predicted TIM-barrel fold metal-dependent hydrolase
MIIDFHSHCFADSLAERAITELSKRAGIPPWHDGTINGLIKSMDEAGIHKSVILPIATKPSQTIKINDWAASVSSSRIIPFGSIHPDFEDWKHEVTRIKELGLKGVKFHPDYQNFFVDDEKLFPLYEAILDADLILIFHAGVDIGFPAPYHCMPSMLKNLLDHFKRGKIVAAHMGGYMSYDDVEKYLIGEDIYLDTSYCMGEISTKKATKLIKDHGISKVLFGTDSPWKKQSEEVALIEKLDLTEDEKAAILCYNSCMLLGISQND